MLFEPEQVLRYVEEPEAVRSHEQLVHDYLEVLPISSSTFLKEQGQRVYGLYSASRWSRKFFITMSTWSSSDFTMFLSCPGS